MKQAKKKETVYASFEDYRKKFYPMPSDRQQIKSDQPYKLGVSLARKSFKNLTDLQD